MKITEVALHVKDLEKMTLFYTNVIGLSIIEATETEVLLGNPRIRLVSGATRVANHNVYGLYHTAFLLRSEAQLGAFLRKVSELRTPLSGAGDHIFSQAIYLNDPEGNGVEVYADRPQASWKYDADGKIEAATLEVDIEHLLEVSAHETYDSEGMTIGHVHLEVGSMDQVKSFYVDELGFDIKTEIGKSALFISKDGYHHHFGFNNWLRPNQGRDDYETGLLYVAIDDSTLEAKVTKDPFGNTLYINTL